MFISAEAAELEALLFESAALLANVLASDSETRAEARDEDAALADIKVADKLPDADSANTLDADCEAEAELADKRANVAALAAKPLFSSAVAKDAEALVAADADSSAKKEAAALELSAELFDSLAASFDELAALSDADADSLAAFALFAAV